MEASPILQKRNRKRSRHRHPVRTWRVDPAHASGPDSAGRRGALGRPGREGFLQAAFLVAVLEAGRPGCGGWLLLHKRPFMMLNKAASEPRLGCANTHIWAAGRSRAAELPTAGQLLLTFWTKGALALWGLPGNLGLGRVQPSPSPPRGAALSGCHLSFSLGLEL